MLSCRRAVPIPQDFSRALARFGLTPDDLLPLLKPVVTPDVALPPLPSPPPEETSPPLLAQIDPTLRGELPTPTVTLPSHFPALPGQHTYRATSVFSEPVKDPRKIREKAADEGRLGEESLRRLLADSSKALRNATQAQGRVQSRSTPKEGWWQRAEEERWEQTMQALSRDGADKNKGDRLSGGRGDENDGLVIDWGLDGTSDPRVVQGGEVHPTAESKGDTGGIVNSEKKYQRKGGRGWSGNGTKLHMASEDIAMTGTD